MSAPPPLLDVRGLKIAFGPTRAVDDVSISVAPGELVGIVGESGSGKSTLVRALLDLLPGRADLAFERFAVDGRALQRRDLAGLRGGTFAMIFQDPLSYLNPLMTAGRQIAELVRRYEPGGDTEARVRELLAMVQLPPERHASYPHELSGGMRQRVLIAIALGCRPRMLIADEPTTALDVTTQAEILILLRKLSHDLGMALLLISHDLGVIATLCQRLHVMRHGKVVEEGPLREVFARPRHRYTLALLNADRAIKDERGRFVIIDPDG